MRNGFFILMFLCAVNLHSQSDEDFERMGKILFDQITQSETENHVPIIRIQRYHDLIDEQDLDTRETQRRHHQLEESYDQIYKNYVESIRNLKNHYISEQVGGASLEYYKCRYWPTGDLKGTYHVDMSFIYRKGDVQNVVHLTFSTAWLEERQALVMISGIKEDF